MSDSEMREVILEIAARNHMRRELGEIDLEACRLQTEAEIHEAWAERERAKGRGELELTWGNCVRECLQPLGFFKPQPIQ